VNAAAAGVRHRTAVGVRPQANGTGTGTGTGTPGKRHTGTPDNGIVH